MGKVFRGAEVTRVYVGSFRDQPPSHEALTGNFGCVIMRRIICPNDHLMLGLFERDKKELLCRIDELPKAKMFCRLNSSLTFYCF
jgi:hypothetical protein